VGVRTLLAGETWVHYSQIYVQSEDEPPRPERAFAGQANGLCGAAIPGALFLVTGLHTGRVGFTVEVHDDAPPLEPAWEEVVEADFAPTTPHAALCPWGGGGPAVPLGLARGRWRVRYCAIGMDAGHGAAPPDEGEAPVDRYLLQFWPAPPTGDRVVRQTSAAAEYWHGAWHTMPPLPDPPEDPEAAAIRAHLLSHTWPHTGSGIVHFSYDPPMTRVNHVGLCVTDLAMSRRFYEEALGFIHRNDIAVPDAPASRLLQVPEPVRLTAVYLEREGFVLELLHFARAGNEPARDRTFTEPGLTHLSFTVDDLAATCARVTDFGGEVLRDTDMGGRAIMVRDPDGQLLELLPDRARPSDSGPVPPRH
jgi:catechol 2,3-dioxygenase-like lactoylglutathione lyase family enzyme